jgi:hypothetical protein
MYTIPEELTGAISIDEGGLQLHKPKTRVQRLAIGRIVGSGAIDVAACAPGMQRSLRRYRLEAEKADQAENARWEREWGLAHHAMLESIKSLGLGNERRARAAAQPDALPAGLAIVGQVGADRAKLLEDLREEFDGFWESRSLDGATLLGRLLAYHPTATVAELVDALETFLGAVRRPCEAALAALRPFRGDAPAWFSGELAGLVRAAGDGYADAKRDACLDRGDFDVVRRMREWNEALSRAGPHLPDDLEELIQQRTTMDSIYGGVPSSDDELAEALSLLKGAGETRARALDAPVLEGGRFSFSWRELSALLANLGIYGPGDNDTLVAIVQAAEAAAKHIADHDIAEVVFRRELRCELCEIEADGIRAMAEREPAARVSF